MKDGESRARDEMREIREEVNNIREMIPKVMAFLLPVKTSTTHCSCSDD